MRGPLFSSFYSVRGKSLENIILNFVLYNMLKKQIPEKKKVTGSR